MLDSIICPDCKNNIPQPASCCPHCGRPGIFWNVIRANSDDERAALQSRYDAAKADARSRGADLTVNDFESFGKVIMNAIVSGRSGRALLLDGESLKSFDLDDPTTIVSRHRSELPYLFGEAADLRTIENTTIESVERELKADCHFAWALDLALISLDAELEDDIRTDALEDLEGLLADGAVLTRLGNVFYSKPLPEEADLHGALNLCDSRLRAVTAFLTGLQERQPSITSVNDAFELIPTKTFGSHENREVFRHVAVKEGLFHSLATVDLAASISTFHLKARLSTAVQKLPNYRQVLQAWTKPFRQSPKTQDLIPDDDEETRSDRFRKRTRIDGRAVLHEALKKKSVIVAAMQRRDLARVADLVDELVSYQQINSASQHTAKSLCDLAMEAKTLGISSLQLALTERSINVAPGDGWSWAQYGDALLQTGRFDEALTAYEQANAFGAGVVAKTGRAEVLKGQGQLAAALIAFEEVIREYPADVVAKNGRAEVLKAQGRLSAALTAYEEVIRDHPADVVAKTGRAEVLKAQGQLPAALTAYEEVIREHPENIVAKTGWAAVLKAQGQFAVALTAFEEVLRTHPADVFAKTGRAEVLKAQGRLAAALAAFDVVIRQHPENVVAKTGRSCVLIELNRYQEALESISTKEPITIDDWIEYHIRGMILLRLGKMSEAIGIFNHGLQDSPFPSTKDYFKGALALSWLRGRKYKEAGEVLDAVSSPLLQPSANVIRIHAFGAQGNPVRARQAYEKLTATPHLLADELTQELHHQYILHKEPTKDEEWVFEREVRVFLRVA